MIGLGESPRLAGEAGEGSREDGGWAGSKASEEGGGSEGTAEKEEVGEAVAIADIAVVEPVEVEGIGREEDTLGEGTRNCDEVEITGFGKEEPK